MFSHFTVSVLAEEQTDPEQQEIDAQKSEGQMDVEVDAPYIVLEDFEEGISSWKVTGARYNTINASISNEVVRFGNNALKLDYDFIGTQGTSGVYASKDTEIDIPGTPEKIGMWVYGDGNKHWLRQQVTDANGQSFNIDFTNDYPNGVTWEGWKYVEASIPSDWEAPFRMDLPVRYMATNDDGKTADTIYIDNIRAIYGEFDEDVTNPTLSNFTPSENEITNTNQPEISAIGVDEESGIDEDRIFMKIDGNAVTPEFDVETGKVSYTPDTPLAEGLHEARVEVYDNAGNHKFHSWKFEISTGGPQLKWEGPEEAYAGSTFELDLMMEEANTLSGMEAQFSYDSNLLELVDGEGDKSGIQIEIPEKYENAIVENTVNEKTGEIHLKWDNLQDISNSDEEVFATMTFRLGLDASGEVDLAMTNGSLTYTDSSIGTLPFFVKPFRAPIEQPLKLSIEGKSLNTPSKITVEDQQGNAVEGAKINILNDQKLIKVVEPTDIYKGGSGVAGEPFKSVDVGTYMPIAKYPYDGFDYYRIFMPNGEQRYYHVPKEDVEEVEWSSLFEETDRNGEMNTDLLTIARIPIKIQASKGELVSQVMSFETLPQLGTQKPENIVLTWVSDPKTSQHFTWRTGTAVTDSVVEVVPEGNGFDSEKLQRYTGTSELFSNEEAEMMLHYSEATGLSPGMTYQYRVGDGTEGSWSEVGTFTTESAEEEPFRFMFVTDTQAQNREGFEYWTDLYNLSLEKFPGTNVVLHGGDIVDEGNNISQWEYFMEASQDVTTKLPFMSVLGNHEVYGDGENIFKNLFPYPQNGPSGKEGFVYSFDYGNARFLMLNSEFGIQDMEEQQEWLRQEIEESDKQWTIAMFHRAPYSSNPLTGTGATAETFAPVLEELGVDLVLTGHDHAYMKSHLMKDGQPHTDGNGTQYMIGGSAGPKFYPAQTYEYVDVLFDEDTQLFTSFLIDGDTLTAEVYTIDDELVDTFTLQKEVDDEEEEQEEQANPEEDSSDEQNAEEKEPTTGDNQQQKESNDSSLEESDTMENEQENGSSKESGSEKVKDNESTDESGELLPETATSMYRWLLAGLISIITGLSVIVYRRIKGIQN